MKQENQKPRSEKETRSRIGWAIRSFFILAVLGSAGITVAGSGAYWLFSVEVPDLFEISQYRPLGVTQILGSGAPDASGRPEVLAEFYKERRYLLPPEKMPELVVRAFVSAEDDRFFEHQGFNVAAILRAAIANFKAGHVVQGGSTITQQVAKSLLLTSEKSFTRKFKEVILASRMEKNLTKQQILYLYLNQIYLGNGAYGVEAAARAYFRKTAAELSLAEAAILAGMPQAPGKYSPLLSPGQAKRRQLYVLRRMYENKYITQSQMAEAGDAPLKVYRADESSKGEVGYFVEHVRRQLLSKYGEKSLYEDGLTVRTAASREMLHASYRSLQDGLRQIDKRMGFRGPIQRVTAAPEQEKFLAEARKALIRESLEFEALTREGELDLGVALQLAGVKSDLELLKPDSLYRAMVLSVDDKRKTASVAIGAAKGEIPLELMKWARPARSDGQGAGGPEPSVVSKLLRSGDVIWVRLATSAERTAKNLGPQALALEQKPEVQGALMSIDVATGRVIAMQGGYDFKDSEFNRAVQAARQPGSAFKPFIYSAALEKGFTPASIIVDAPIVYADGDEGKWKPANYEEKFYGDTTMRLSLIKSRNVPTIKLVQAVKVSEVIDYVKRLGMTGDFSPDLSIALGSAAVNLYDLTKLYAVYPRLGRSLVPVDILSVFDRDGKELEKAQEQPALTASAWKSLMDSNQLPGTPSENENSTSSAETAEAAPDQAATEEQRYSEFHGPLERRNFDLLKKLGVGNYPTAKFPNQVIDPRVAFVMTHLMSEVITFGTGSEARNLGRPSAGKTGTTNDYLDAWFMAYTPQVVTGVWVGYDSQRPLGSGETGGRAALPIWLSFMKEAMKSYPPQEFEVPQGVTFATIHGENGKILTSGAPGAVSEAFISGTVPSTGAAGGNNEASDSAENGDFLKEDMQ